jgi:hypothetical protein
MPRLPINQTVDVHSHPPGTQPTGGSTQGDEHVHPFVNLIPACEFAVSLAREGHLDLTLHTETGVVLNIGDAQRIVEIWESGAAPFDAEDIEF